ncbi:hypothetical protein AVEN_163730-1 [Araneus ventricosus]|uniref:Uncharacterized protein n=1 Tax=Araneus ventricosus TaxID=182803 RepID=A0A4Y2LXY1_ARAVE|nr:hypothetical protein AVEN_163730-1 [Araneus ventricosus]
MKLCQAKAYAVYDNRLQHHRKLCQAKTYTVYDNRLQHHRKLCQAKAYTSLHDNFEQHHREAVISKAAVFLQFTITVQHQPASRHVSVKAYTGLNGISKHGLCPNKAYWLRCGSSNAVNCTPCSQKYDLKLSFINSTKR